MGEETQFQGVTLVGDLFTDTEPVLPSLLAPAPVHSHWVANWQGSAVEHSQINEACRKGTQLLLVPFYILGSTYSKSHHPHFIPELNGKSPLNVKLC